MSSPITNPDVYMYSDPKKNKVKSSAGAGAGKKVGSRKGSKSKSKYKPTPADKERIAGASKVV
jgi:hypothetical protein